MRAVFPARAARAGNTVTSVTSGLSVRNALGRQAG